VRQIVAIGGVTSPGDRAFFPYIIAQARRDRPRVGFLPTASGDSDPFIVRFYESFAPLPCEPSHLALFRSTPDLDTYIPAQDIILVAGGNTKSMLAVWREWGLDVLLRQAWESGTILAGFSAGAICWFAEGLSDSWADRLAPVPGLELITGSCCPHYGNEPQRRPVFHELVASGVMQPGIGIDDGAALHVRDSQLRVVQARCRPMRTPFLCSGAAHGRPRSSASASGSARSDADSLPATRTPPADRSGCPVVERPQSFRGLELGTRMSVVRMGSGRLWLHSPVRLDPELCAQLDAIGPVALAVAPNRCTTSTPEVSATCTRPKRLAKDRDDAGPLRRRCAYLDAAGAGRSRGRDLPAGGPTHPGSADRAVMDRGHGQRLLNPVLRYAFVLGLTRWGLTLPAVRSRSVVEVFLQALARRDVPAYRIDLKFNR
jgi:dipeptidase E